MRKSHYYKASFSIKKTGIIPQISDFLESDINHSQLKNWEYDDSKFDPNFKTIELNNRAKYTDAIIPITFTSHKCHILSKEGIDFWLDHNIPDYIVCNVSVKKKSTEARHYYILKLLSDGAEYIDVNSTKFSIWNDLTKKSRAHSLDSEMLYKVLSREVYPFKYPEVFIVDHLVIKADVNYDAIPTSIFSTGLVVSEKVKTNMEKSSLNFFDFTPLDGQNGRPLVSKKDDKLIEG